MPQLVRKTKWHKFRKLNMPLPWGHLCPKSHLILWGIFRWVLYMHRFWILHPKEQSVDVHEKIRQLIKIFAFTLIRNKTFGNLQVECVNNKNALLGIFTFLYAFYFILANFPYLKNSNFFKNPKFWSQKAFLRNITYHFSQFLKI